MGELPVELGSFAFPLEYFGNYPVTLAQWHWNVNRTPTPISGDPTKKELA